MSDDFDFFALVAAGGNSRAARSARAKLQWRDRYGRWIEMGRGVKFKLRFPDGAPRSVVGKFVGATDPDTGQLYVSKDPNGLPDGFYKIKSDNAQEFLADLSPSQLKARGIEVGKDANGKPVGERLSENIPTTEEVERLDAPEGWKRLPGTYAGKHVIETEDGDFRIHFGGKDNKWAVEDVKGAPGQATAYTDAGDAFKQVADLDLEREESGDTAYTGLEKDNEEKVAQLGRDELIDSIKLNERTINNERASIDAKQRAMQQNNQLKAELEGKGFDPYDPEGNDSDEALAARKTAKVAEETPSTPGAIDTDTFGVEKSGFLVPTGKKTSDISPQGLADHINAEIEHYSEGGKRIVIDTDNNEAEGYNSADDFNDAKAQAGGVGATEVLDLAAGKVEPVEAPENVDSTGDNTPRDQEAPDAEVRSTDAEQSEGSEPGSGSSDGDSVGGEAEPAKPAAGGSGGGDDGGDGPDEPTDTPSEPDGSDSNGEPSPDDTPSHAPGSVEELQARRNQLQAALENSGDPKDMVALNDQIDELDNRIAAKQKDTPLDDEAKDRDDAQPGEDDGESPADAPEQFREATVPVDAEQPDSWEPKEDDSDAYKGSDSPNPADWDDEQLQNAWEDGDLYQGPASKQDIIEEAAKRFAKPEHPEKVPEARDDHDLGDELEQIENEQTLLEHDRDRLMDEAEALGEPELDDDVNYEKQKDLWRQVDALNDKIKELDDRQYGLIKDRADRYVEDETFKGAMEAFEGPRNAGDLTNEELKAEINRLNEESDAAQTRGDDTSEVDAIIDQMDAEWNKRARELDNPDDWTSVEDLTDEQVLEELQARGDMDWGAGARPEQDEKRNLDLANEIAARANPTAADEVRRGRMLERMPVPEGGFESMTDSQLHTFIENNDLARRPLIVDQKFSESKQMENEILDAKYELARRDPANEGKPYKPAKFPGYSNNGLNTDEDGNVWRWDPEEKFYRFEHGPEGAAEEHPESVPNIPALREETLAALNKANEVSRELHAVNEQLLDKDLPDDERAALTAKRDMLQIRFEGLDGDFSSLQSRFQRARLDAQDLESMERGERNAQADADAEARRAEHAARIAAEDEEDDVLAGIEDATRAQDMESGLAKMDENRTDDLTTDEVKALDVEDAGWDRLLKADEDRGAKWEGMDPDQIAGGVPYLDGQPDFYAVDQDATNALAKVSAWMNDPDHEGTWEELLTPEEFNAFEEAHARDSAWVNAKNTWNLDDQPAWVGPNGETAYEARRNALDKPTKPEQLKALEELTGGMTQYQRDVFDRDVDRHFAENPDAERIGLRPDPIAAEANRLAHEQRIQEAREKAIAERAERDADPNFQKLKNAVRGTRVKVASKKFSDTLVKARDGRWLNTRSGQWLDNDTLHRITKDGDPKFSFSDPDDEVINAGMTREELDEREERISDLAGDIDIYNDALDGLHPDSEDAESIQDKLWDAESEYNDLMVNTPEEGELFDGGEGGDEPPSSGPEEGGDSGDAEWQPASVSDIVNGQQGDQWRDEQGHLWEHNGSTWEIIDGDEETSTDINDPNVHRTGIIENGEFKPNDDDPLNRLAREQANEQALDDQLQDVAGDAMRAQWQDEQEAAADEWAKENNLGDWTDEQIAQRMGELRRGVREQLNEGDFEDDLNVEMQALGDEMVKRERARRVVNDAANDMLEADLEDDIYGGLSEEEREDAIEDYYNSPEGIADREATEDSVAQEIRERQYDEYQASLAADGYKVMDAADFDSAAVGDTAIDLLTDIEYTHNGTAFVNDEIDEEVQVDIEGLRKNSPNLLNNFIFKKSDEPAAPTPKAPGTPYLPALGAAIGRAADIFKGKRTGKEALDALRGEDVFMIDFETTGFTDLAAGANETNKPVQMGIVHMRNGEEVGRLNLFMNPGEPLGEFSKNNLIDPQGNPLTDEYLATQPSIGEAMQQAKDFIGPNAILGGQNTQFDTDVLRRALEESGVEFEWDGVLDSKAMADVLLPKEDENGRISRSLDPLRKWLNNDLGNEDIAEGNWHEATSDALKSYQIMESLLNRAIRDDQDVSALSEDPADQNRQKYADSTYPKYLGDLESYLRATGVEDSEIDRRLERARELYNPEAIDKQLGINQAEAEPPFQIINGGSMRREEAERERAKEEAMAEYEEMKARAREEANQVPSDVAVGDILEDKDGNLWEVVGVGDGGAGIRNGNNLRTVEIGDKNFHRVQEAPINYSPKSKNIQAERNSDPYAWAQKNPEQPGDQSYRNKLQALAVGKDLTPDEQINVTFALNDPATTTDELIDIERMLAAKPNAANTETRPRPAPEPLATWERELLDAFNDNVPPVPPEVLAQQDDPSFNDGFDIMWQGILDAFPDATVSAEGDLIIDRIDDFTTPAKRNNKIGKDYELRIRRTGRDTAFVYIMEIDRKTGERKALRLSPETHSWDTFAGRLQKAQAVFADPKLHITVSRSDATEHLGVNRDVGENPLHDFLERGERPNGPDEAFNMIANLVIDRILAGEKFGTVINHLRKLEGTDKDAVNRVAQAFIAQQMAPNAENFTPHEVHTSYDGRKVKAGDRFEWTDHRRYLDWYKPTMRPNPNYRKVYRGTVIDLRDTHSDGKGRRYGDDLVIQFDAGQDKNTNWGSLAAQAIRIIDDDSSPLGEPFEAKREELRTPEAIARAFNLPKSNKTMTDVVPSKPRPAKSGPQRIGSAVIDRASGYARTFRDVRVPFDRLQAASLIEDAEKTNLPGKDLKPGDMFIVMDDNGDQQIHTVLKVNPDLGTITSGVSENGSLAVYHHTATEADYLVTKPNWPAPVEMPDHVDNGYTVIYQGKPYIVVDMTSDAVYINRGVGDDIRVTPDELEPGSKDTAETRVELLEALAEAGIDPREHRRLMSNILDPASTQEELDRHGEYLAKLEPTVGTPGAHMAGAIGVPPGILARLAERFVPPGGIGKEDKFTLRVPKKMKGSLSSVRADLADTSKFTTLDMANLPDELPAGTRVMFVDNKGNHVIALVQSPWEVGYPMRIVVEASDDPDGTKTRSWRAEVGTEFSVWDPHNDLSNAWTPTPEHVLSGDVYDETVIENTPEAQKVSKKIQENYKKLLKAYKSGWEVLHVPQTGIMHDVGQIVQPKDGSPQIFMKSNGTLEAAHKEYLSVVVANALGITNIEAAFDAETTMFIMNAVQGGMDGGDYRSPNAKQVDLYGLDLFGPEGAWKMALLDYIIGNTDRHYQNYKVVPGDPQPIYPIDHGNVDFTYTQDVDYFSKQLMRRINDGSAPLTSAEILRLRNQLVAALPHFQSTGHEDWFEAVIRNMDTVLESVRNMEGKKAP